MKMCNSCKEEKGLEKFSLRKTGKPQSECRVCAAKRSNRWYYENRQHSLDQRKKYYELHREDSLRKGKERYIANYEEIRKKANARNRTTEARAKANIKSREWAKRNPEKLRERCREYKRKNPEKARAHQYVLWAIRLNVIQKPSVCQMCGMNKKLEAHHKDYSKPLDVLWVCKICHEYEHHKDDYGCGISGGYNAGVHNSESKKVDS